MPCETTLQGNNCKNREKTRQRLEFILSKPGLRSTHALVGVVVEATFGNARMGIPLTCEAQTG